MNFVANQDVREHIRESNVKMWEVARRLGIADSTFCRRLRFELPRTEKQKIMAVVNELREEAQHAETD